MRMVAIFVMVWVHFVENLSGVIPSITGFGAPLFSFLAGVSYCLWIEQQGERLSSEAISKISIRRGLFVFGVGIAFNVLVWLPEDTFNWDVLTLIGTALLILNASRHMPDYVLLMAAGSSIFVTPMLQGLADYNSYWPENYYDGDLTLSGILIGYFVVGYFPFFPWISYSLVGFVIARRLFTQETALRIDWKPVCWIGLGLLLFAFGLHWLSSQLGGSFAASAMKRVAFYRRIQAPGAMGKTIESYSKFQPLFVFNLHPPSPCPHLATVDFRDSTGRRANCILASGNDRTLFGRTSDTVSDGTDSVSLLPR